jgi:hypothetical protein
MKSNSSLSSTPQVLIDNGADIFAVDKFYQESILWNAVSNENVFFLIIIYTLGTYYYG